MGDRDELTAAEALVQPFADARRALQEQSDAPVPRPAYTSDNEDERQALQRDIVRTRAEIAALEKQVEIRADVGRSEDQLSSVLDNLLQLADSSFIEAEGATTKRRKGKEDAEKRKREEEWNARARTHVKTLQAVTGLSITLAENHPCVLTDGTPGWTYKLSGSSHGIRFSVSFDAEASEDKHAVRRLDIDVPQRAELAPFIKTTTDDLGLHAFFRGFTRYTRAVSRRGLVMTAICDTFPDYAHLLTDEPTCRVLRCDGNGKGLPFDIVWRLSVSNDAQLVESIEMCPRSSAKMMEDPSISALVRVAPERFATLVGIRGVKSAIEVLIRAAWVGM